MIFFLKKYHANTHDTLPRKIGDRGTLFNILFTIFLFTCLHTAASAQTITLSSPSSGGNVIDNMAVVFAISGETGSISKVQLVFKYTVGYFTANIGRIDTLTMFSISATQSFSFNPSNAAKSALFATTPKAAVNLPDGVYTINAQYTRSTGDVVKSNSVTNVTSDTQALPPTMFTPLANAKVKATFSYKDAVPETYAANTRKVTFLSAATGESSVLTLPNGIFNQSYTLDAKSLRFAGSTLTGSNTLADGTYQISLAYRDNNFHNSTPVSRFITIDSKTQPPEIIRPSASSRQSAMLDILLNIPEKISSGTAKLLFKKSGGGTDSLVLSSPAYGTNSLRVNLKDIAASTAISSSSTASLADGQYDVIFKYADSLGNTTASDTLSSMQLDNSTLAPEMSSPTDSILLRLGDKLNLNFSLPETPLAGSVKAIFSKSGVSSSVFLNSSNSGTHTFEIDPSAISSSIGVLSSGSDYLADGIYDLLLSYQDALGNPAASTTSKKVIIDRESLSSTLILPGDSTINSGNLEVSFVLPEAAQKNQVKLKLLGCETIDLTLKTSSVGLQTYRINANNLFKTTGLLSASSQTIPNGNYTLGFFYQDSLGNEVSNSVQTNIRLADVIAPPVFTIDSIPAPACGALSVDLMQAIASDTTGLEFSFYTDSAMTKSANKLVSSSGKFWVKAKNIHDTFSWGEFILDDFSLCGTDLNGKPTTKQTRFLNKHGKKGSKKDNINKHGAIINKP